MRVFRRTFWVAAFTATLWMATAIRRAVADANDPPPATQPGVVDGSQDDPIPDEYSILRTKDAFSPSGVGNGSGPAADGPEASLVLKGVIESDGKCTAFVEDLNTKQISEAVVGQSLAGGIVKSIDLDAVEFEMAGNVRRIEVGHTLTGGLPPPPPPPPPPPQNGPPPEGGNAPAGPPNGNGPPNPMPPRQMRHG